MQIKKQACIIVMILIVTLIFFLYIFSVLFLPFLAERKKSSNREKEMRKKLFQNVYIELKLKYCL